MQNSILAGLDQLIDTLRTGGFDDGDNPPGPDDIKALRKASGLTQKDFSNWVGVSVDTLKSWECGRRSPARTAARVLRAYQRALERA